MTPVPPKPETAATVAPAIPVEVIADFTADVLGRYLTHDDDAPRVNARVAPFGQVMQSLTAPDSETDNETETPDETVALVWTRPETIIEPFARLLGFEAVDPAMLLEAVDRFADALLHHRRRRRALLVTAWSVPSWQRGWGMLDLAPGGGIRHALLRMNLRLAERLAEADGCFLLSTDPWRQQAGPRADDPKAWFVTKVPYANAVFQAAVGDIKAALRGLAGNARKLVVVDLDDTLWGGIVGDVGWQQLRLGGHDPVGEAFVAFQQTLLALTRRGIQLGIVSKNEKSVALEAIDQHPDMVLRRDHFAGWRINWHDKAHNLAALAEELELGLDAVVFVDDNPAEQARVRETFPAVLVPAWSRDPMRSAAMLRGLACFDQPMVSVEDRQRTAMYTAERARRASRDAEASLDDWLASLDLCVTAKLLDEADLPRTTQLLNKTNQMNLATRRRTEQELRAWAAVPGQVVWTFRVADRFGDAGLTGILGLARTEAQAHVTDFVLSCRVMGRRVEETMVHHALAWARTHDLATVVAPYQPTERNRPCLRFWHGMAGSVPGIVATPHDDATVFACPADALVPLPAGVTLTVDGPLDAAP